MDRYMNDTHSLYYNVDHSSMFGSNLSTVFADGPPPLEDGDDDHGEFVFSSETDAIGEAVLSKIEGKLQRDAEDEKSSLHSDHAETNQNSEKFEAFANFETAKHNNASDGQEGRGESPKEVNGLYKENIKNRTLSEDDFSNNEFGDFSTGFATNSKFSESDNDTKGDDINFGSFSAFNKRSELNNGLTSNEQVSLNGDDGNNSKTGSESNNFANFSSFDDVDFQTGGNIKDQQQSWGQFPTQTNGNEIQNDDDEFGSFDEADDGDFANFESTEVEISSNSEGHSSEDATLSNGMNKPADMNPPSVLTDKETNNDGFNSFEGFNKDKPCMEKDDMNNTPVRKDMTHNEPNNDDTFMASKDVGFNDFTSANDEFGSFSQSSPRTEAEKNKFASFKSKSQLAETSVSNPPATDLEVQSNKNVETTSGDDDFGDFADFSQNSFSAFSSDSDISSEKQSDSTFGTFSTNESSTMNVADSNFGKFPDNARTSADSETKVLSQQKSDDFTAFSESTSSNNKPEFSADFGAFSEHTSTRNKNELKHEFGAFSDTTTNSKNKQGFQADFGAFSQNVSQKSFDQTSSAKQHGSIQTQLVSLHACFQDVFITLQHKVQELQHVKAPGDKRRKQENLWKHLNYNMGEAELRFNWEKCQTSDKMCGALDVSKKDINVNPNILAMSEGLEIPVFATGLGILQPSIVPAPPKKKKTKSKGDKNSTSSTPDLPSPTLSPSLPQQTVSEVKTENMKENNSDTTSLSNSDASSLDLDFFASAPSNLPVNLDPGSSSSLYNLDFAFAQPTPPANQGSFPSSPLKSSSTDFDVFKTSKPVQDDPLEILKKLDTSKMSSTITNENQAQLSSKAKEIIEEFDDLSFMHSSVLMFPLNKSN